MLIEYAGTRPDVAGDAFIAETATVIGNVVLGAGALVTEGKEIPPGSLVVGVPAKVVRPLTPEEIAGIGRSAEGYFKRSRAFLGGQAVTL